jgi:hypothetical protein
MEHQLAPAIVRIISARIQSIAAPPSVGAGRQHQPRRSTAGASISARVARGGLFL